MDTATQVLVILGLISAIPVAIVVLVALLRGYAIEVGFRRKDHDRRGGDASP